MRRLRATMLAVNGPRTIALLRKVLQANGLTSSRPKAELVQRVQNSIHIIHDSDGLQLEALAILEDNECIEHDDEPMVIVSFVCLDDEVGVWQ